jgi:hypothetical protein
VRIRCARDRPWSLPLQDRALLATAYWRTNLTLRQPAPLFGVSTSAADRIVDHLGPSLALQPRKRFRRDAVLIVDGTPVPTSDHQVADPSKNSRYSTNHQVVIHAGTRLENGMNHGHFPKACGPHRGPLPAEFAERLTGLL